MVDVYNIIKQLESTTQKNEKECILKENKDNLLLREVFRLTYSPTVNFYMKKTLQYSFVEDKYTLEEVLIHLGHISSRELTGNAAITFVQDSLMLTSPDNAVVVQRILQGEMGCGVGVSTLNKVWKGLIVKPPRQGAKSMNEKTLAVIEKCKNKAIELKSDGTYLAFEGDLMTRNGNTVLVEPLSLHLNCGAFEGFALEGEGVYDLTKATREEGNGIIGKIIKGTSSEEDKDGLIYQVWDCVDTHYYEAKGKYPVSNSDRRVNLECMIGLYKTWCDDQNLFPKIQLIPRTEYVSMEEANTIFEEYVRQGFEGAILKDMDSPWSDNGKPSCCVKMKRKEPADLEVVGIYEGEGKAIGSLGGISLESSCGVIKVNCGSGFSDAQRQYYWDNPNEIMGKVVEVEYDSVTQNKNTREVKSLFLPIFKKVRVDKFESDSYEDVLEKQVIK